MLLWQILLRWLEYYVFFCFRILLTCIFVVVLKIKQSWILNPESMAIHIHTVWYFRLLEWQSCAANSIYFWHANRCLRKRRSCWNRNCLDQRGTSNPNLRIHAECFTLWWMSYDGYYYSPDLNCSWFMLNGILPYICKLFISTINIFFSAHLLPFL